MLNSKITTKKYRSKMLPETHIRLAVLCLVSVCVQATWPVKECSNIDVRNNCDSLMNLKDCTVVIGYVMITLMPNLPNTPCQYENYTFPRLREVTDYMIFYEVKGLKSLANMFPNLTVIRGRRLFLNYALGFTNMASLQRMEFPSLVAIQRGHVYIGRSPRLCQLEGINWDRLTLQHGENHILVDSSSKNCTERAQCQGCVSGFCWSSSICQLFENDSVIKRATKEPVCHEQCLGGCYNSTNRDCVVCRTLTDHGACVDRCPADKFLLDQHQRCYTHDECTVQYKHFTFGFECVPFCPSGYRADRNTRNCERCATGEACIATCMAEYDTGAITIYSLADADNIRGCQIVNASLIITIRNKVNEQELVRSFSSIREIRGHLKIYKAAYLTSLKFLSNIQRVYGDPRENDLYAFVLYDNKNLRDLWVPQNFELMHGGMYVHRNNKLCNHNMRAFQERVRHDKSLDSLQTNDHEVLCGPSKLNLGITEHTQRTIRLSWLKEQTSEQIEIIYRSVPQGSNLSDESDLDAPICSRNNWQRRLLFPHELQDNNTHYSYSIEGLQQNTRYGCLVRTFGTDYQHDARSDLMYVSTDYDIPSAPSLRIVNKTDTSFTLDIAPLNNNFSSGFDHVDFYLLSVKSLPDNQSVIDQRNYCRQPVFILEDMDKRSFRMAIEDYDDCCAAQMEKTDDQHFVQLMRGMFSCNLSEKKFCSLSQPLLKEFDAVRLERNASLHTIKDLKRYNLYAIQVRACNSLGCSSPSALYERTNYSFSADFITDLSACRVPGSQFYIAHFSEPKLPNSVIISYAVHYRINIPNSDMYQSNINCVTRLQHEQSNFTNVINLNDTYEFCAVRVNSLAGGVLSKWVNISECTNVPPRIINRIKAHDELPLSELADNNPHGINIFVLFFLVGCVATILWIMYKRRCWRKIPQLRRYIPVVTPLPPSTWIRTQAATQPRDDDREILVDSFETVRFQNNNVIVGREARAVDEVDGNM